MTTDKRPVIELRKVRESRSLSEETPAYTADVFVDGKRFCTASNHGQGGPDMHHPFTADRTFRTRLEALEKLIAETYPAETYEAGGETHSFPCSLELLC